MQTLRVSATDIDAFRRFRDREDADLGSLLRQLRRQEPPTEAMMAGTALHAILETAEECDLKGATDGEFSFSFDLDEDLDLPPIREMKATAEHKIDGCIITLVGKVDAVHGRRVVDHKLTSHFDADRYLGSYQWRIYLDIFGADEFIWNVFEAREGAPRNYLIHHLHRLRVHRYPGMGDDVRRELAAYLDFARVHLPEKLGAWEPSGADFLAY